MVAVNYNELAVDSAVGSVVDSAVDVGHSESTDSHRATRKCCHTINYHVADFVNVGLFSELFVFPVPSKILKIIRVQRVLSIDHG